MTAGLPLVLAIRLGARARQPDALFAEGRHEHNRDHEQRDDDHRRMPDGQARRHRAHDVAGIERMTHPGERPVRQQALRQRMIDERALHAHRLDHLRPSHAP